MHDLAIVGEPSLLALKYLKQQKGSAPALWLTADPRATDRFADTSWLLVHLLLDAWRSALNDFLRGLALGMEPEKAFNQAFPELAGGRLDGALADY